jgi:hypothetical protein
MGKDQKATRQKQGTKGTSCPISYKKSLGEKFKKKFDKIGQEVPFTPC